MPATDCLSKEELDNLDWYQATDRRVYNGALCSEMQRELDSLKKLEKMLPENARLCYYPLEGTWSCWCENYKGSHYYMLVGPEAGFSNKGDCIIEALKIIAEEEE